MSTEAFEIKDGFVQVPVSIFQVIEARLESLNDNDSPSENIPNYPASINSRLRSGENSLKVLREYRGLSQVGLAEQAGISQAMISSIENGHKIGKIATLKTIADILDIDLLDLV